MMRNFKLAFILLVCGLTLASCSSRYEQLLAGTDYEAKYKEAFKYYNNGKYKRAAELFESLIMPMSGMPQEDTVHFFTGMSNYKRMDYVTAESNFERFIQVFPRSPFTEEATYLRCHALYEKTLRYELDQVPTRKALVAIGEFMRDYPLSSYRPTCEIMQEDLFERLDRKAFESARLYYKMEDYLAAHYALKNVLRDNADNRYRTDILYYTAVSAYKYAQNSVRDKQKERYLTFIDDYYNFISEEASSSRRSFLDGYYQKALRYTKGNENADYEEGVASEENMTKEQRRKARLAAKEVKRAEALLKEAEKKAQAENERKERKSRDKVKAQNKENIK